MTCDPPARLARLPLTLSSMMKTRHAFGFLLLGFALSIVPGLAPGWFPPAGIDGTSTRELWLQFMSWTLWVFGSVQVGGQLLGIAAKLLEYHPEQARTVALPVRRPVHVPAAFAATQAGSGDFPPEWLAERGAA